MSEKRRFAVALRRVYEAENPDESYTRTIAVFYTWATSEASAISKVRFRNGGNKPLHYHQGAAGTLYEDYRIYNGEPIVGM